MSKVGAYLLDNWIAIAAFFISAYVFYKTHLSSFCLAAKTGGRVVISRNPFSFKQKQVSLMLDVILVNDGAKSGVIEDVAICILDDSKRFLFKSKGEKF